MKLQIWKIKSFYDNKLANIVLALFNPINYSIPVFPEKQGWNIQLLQDNFRSLHILANRDGEANKTLGMGYIGEVGHFFELPKPEGLNYSTLKF